MNKAEIIQRYGIERYNEYRRKSKQWSKDKYNNDPEYRLKINERNRKYQSERNHNDPEWNKRVNERNKRYRNSEHGKAVKKQSDKLALLKRYIDDVSNLYKIENYNDAEQDNFEWWDIHHRYELNDDGTLRYTSEQLKELNLYYKRPYYELIFLRHDEHAKLHSKSNPGSFANRQ